jgi:hypothetical protein
VRTRRSVPCVALPLLLDDVVPLLIVLDPNAIFILCLPDGATLRIIEPSSAEYCPLGRCPSRARLCPLTTGAFSFLGDVAQDARLDAMLAKRHQCRLSFEPGAHQAANRIRQTYQSAVFFIFISGHPPGQPSLGAGHLTGRLSGRADPLHQHLSLQPLTNL